MTMDPAFLLHELHGVARVQDLLARGLTRHGIANGVRSGRLVRPRKGWIALPNADPDLVRAARSGGVLTCVTQLRRCGLWVVAEPEHPHLAPPHRSSRRPRAPATVHWNEPVVPRRPGTLTDHVVNALVLAETCQPREQAQTLWESALNQRLVEHNVLRQLPLPRAARRLLDACSPYADSGLETLFRTRLGWLPVSIRTQIWIEGHRVDFLLGDRLVVQIDGGHHVGRQRDRDNAHDARLALLGYRSIRVSYTDVMHHWPIVQETVMLAIARGLHLP